MRFYIKGKVLGVEDENDVVAFGDKLTKVASLIIQPNDGEDPICAKCFGKDKLAVCKEYLRSQKPMEMILTLSGRVIPASEKYPVPKYINEVHLKWVLR